MGRTRRQETNGGNSHGGFPRRSLPMSSSLWGEEGGWEDASSAAMIAPNKAAHSPGSGPIVAPVEAAAGMLASSSPWRSHAAASFYLFNCLLGAFLPSVGCSLSSQAVSAAGCRRLSVKKCGAPGANMCVDSLQLTGPQLDVDGKEGFNWKISPQLRKHVVSAPPCRCSMICPTCLIFMWTFFLLLSIIGGVVRMSTSPATITYVNPPPLIYPTFRQFFVLKPQIFRFMIWMRSNMNQHNRTRKVISCQQHLKKTTTE